MDIESINSHIQKCLDDIIGLHIQKNLVASYALTSIAKEKPFPSTLFIGNSGCGKTHLAKAVARICKSELYELHARTIAEDRSLLIVLLQKIQRSSINHKIIFFLDEIHQLPGSIQEAFYPVLDNPNITILGATTDTGCLLEPFINRFKLSITIDRYSTKDSIDMVKYYFNKKSTKCTEEAAKIIATNSKKTPRIMVHIIDSCINSLDVNNIVNRSKKDIVDEDLVLSTLRGLEIYPLGIDKQSMKALRVMMDFERVSLDTIVAITRIDKNHYIHNCEPHLLQVGFIAKTSRGRSITHAGLLYCKALQNKEGSLLS